MATQSSQVNGPAASGQGQFRTLHPSMMGHTALEVVPELAYKSDDKPSRRARIVAICSLGSSCCNLTLILVILIMLPVVHALVDQLIATGKASVSAKKLKEPGDPTQHNIFYVEISIGVVLTVIEIIAAVGLLKVTKPNTVSESGTVDKAHRKASCWQCYNVLLVFFNFNCGCLCIALAVSLHARPLITSGILYLVTFFVRLLFLLLLYGFIARMEKASAKDPAPASATLSMAETNVPNQQKQPFIVGGASPAK